MAATQILVLDAETDVRNVISAILETAGYSVEAVDSFEAAALVVKTRPPDLLLTNVYLAGITGHEAIRQLKAMRPQLPVLMVSGLPDSDVIREWTGTDRFETFPKPFTAQDLLGKVQHMLPH